MNDYKCFANRWLTVIFALLCVAGIARADIEEVIVTTQKVENNVLDVPYTVEVIDSARISDLGIDNFEKLYHYIPGLNLAPIAGDSTGLRLFIRGIGSTDALIGQDPAVSIYHNGVYYSRGQALNLNFADIERIEVLKGPQGTLYGRNTVGGAINIIARKASAEETFGDVSIGAGTFNQFDAQGRINVALSETSAIKFSAYSNSDDGWVDNTGTGANLSAQTRQGGRFDFNYDDGDFSLNYAFNISSSQDSGYYYQPTEYNAADFNSPLNNNLGDSISQILLPISSDRSDSVNLNQPESVADFSVHSLDFGFKFSDRHNLNLLLGSSNSSSRSYINFNNSHNSQGLRGYLDGVIGGTNQAVLGYNAALGGYSALTAQLNQSLMAIGMPAIPFGQYNPVAPLSTFQSINANNEPAVYGLSTEQGRPFENQALTAEIHFDGASESGQFEYIAGLYFYNEENDYSLYAGNNDVLTWLSGVNFAWIQPANLVQLGQNVESAGAALAQAGAALAGGDTAAAAQQFGVATAQLMTADTLLSMTNSLIRDAGSANAEFASDATSLALYTNVKFIPNEHWDYGLGLRLSSDNRGVETVRFDLFSNLVNSEYSLNADDDFTSVDYQLTINYHPADDSTFYLSLNSAYRAGGFNENYLTTNPEELRFDQEKITGYEFGYKGLLTNSVLLSSSVFFYQLADVQYAVVNPTNPTNRLTANTDGSVVGFETYLLVEFSDNWNIRLSYLNLDRDNDSYIDPFTQLETDAPVVQAPTNSAGFGVNGRVPFADNYDFVVHLSTNYNSSTDIVENVNQAPYSLTDLDMIFNLRSVFVSLWVKNLTDVEYIVDGLPASALGGLSPSLSVFGQPRTFGVGVGYNF